MPGGMPADVKASWPHRVAEGTRPFSHNRPLAIVPLGENTTEGVGEILSPAIGRGGG